MILKHVLLYLITVESRIIQSNYSTMLYLFIICLLWKIDSFFSLASNGFDVLEKTSHTRNDTYYDNVKMLIMKVSN